MNAAPSPEPATPPRQIGVTPIFFAQHNGSRFRTPVDLQVMPDCASHFLVVGGCLAQPIPDIAAMISPDYKGDFILLNNFDSFPEIPAKQAQQYDFQIIHIPLRSVFGNAYFQLPDDAARHEEFLQQTQDYLARYLANVVKLNTQRKLLTFVLGFMVPQQNQRGRFQARYDLRNVMHFVERLNMFLAAEVAKLENAHFVDIDQISSSIGKKNVQDDSVWSFTHGTSLSDGDHDHDLNRIQPPTSMQQHYSARWLEFFEALLHEIFAMHRTLKQQDAVKLVAVDLDDTLWRGVAAEGTLGVLEGWPMGFIETLLILKRRGILLAIVSKNDESFIRSNWNSIVQGQISLADFAVLKINFRSKAENLAEILQEVNLRPENAVMIDDNPVERAAIQTRLPEVRVLGSQLYYLKRVLLWSAETQTGAITAESARKTEMVRAQLQRESARKEMSHEEFLQTLDLRVSLAVLHDTKDVHMSRALELFNKTNQFNTTGVRYTLEQCHQFFINGRQLFIIQAEDRFTKYGLVGAAWVNQNCIEHLVMSCRALGLGIEDSFVAWLATYSAEKKMATLLGQLQPTAANLACRQIFSRNGFNPLAENSIFWSRALELPLVMPRHVTLTVSIGKTSEASRPVGSIDGTKFSESGEVLNGADKAELAIAAR